jgi:predicted nucleic acid-binding protein
VTPATYVLDTGPLSHFARAQWLGVLKAILDDVRVVIPDVVEAELRNGVVQHYHLRAVLDSDWIEVLAVDSTEQLSAFVNFERMLVGPGGRNIGECGVLALAETIPDSVAIIDDRVARNAAQAHKIAVRGTLGLLCDAVRRGLLTVPLVSAVADDLLRNDYRLPFQPGGFAQWAREEAGLT